jgi:replicative DNA helicase
MAEPKIPPHDLEAEKSLLGALLIDKDAVVKVVDFLGPFWNFTPKARRLTLLQ